MCYQHQQEVYTNQADVIMKKSIYGTVFAALVFLFTVSHAQRLSAAAPAASELIGTWELASVKYGDATEFSDAPKDQTARKFITPTHFIWARYDATTKTISNSMGGTFTLKGSDYIESPEFSFKGMERFIGKEQKFTLKIEEDKWIQSGVLSNGNKIEEIWRRVK
jgi:hypothetical protein